MYLPLCPLNIYELDGERIVMLQHTTETHWDRQSTTISTLALTLLFFIHLIRLVILRFSYWGSHFFVATSFLDLTLAIDFDSQTL